VWVDGEKNTHKKYSIEVDTKNCFKGEFLESCPTNETKPGGHEDEWEKGLKKIISQGKVAHFPTLCARTVLLYFGRCRHHPSCVRISAPLIIISPF
jgi:hypothetical protein